MRRRAQPEPQSSPAGRRATKVAEDPFSRKTEESEHHGGQDDAGDHQNEELIAHLVVDVLRYKNLKNGQPGTSEMKQNRRGSHHAHDEERDS